MRNKNRYIQLIYRLVWLAIAITSTVFTFTDHIESIGGDGRPVALFFTTWSVWLATLAAVVVFGDTVYRLFIKKEKEGYLGCGLILKFASNIMIIATFIVAGFVLHQFFDGAGSVFKHFLLPIITVVDSILFDPKNSYRVTYPIFGVVIPLLYWVIVIIRMVIYKNGVVEAGIPVRAASYNQYFPYGFTNLLPKTLIVENLSVLIGGKTVGGKTLGGLCGMLAGILVGLIIIGFVFWVVDKLSIKNKKVVFDSSVNEDTTKDLINLIKNKK